MDIIFGNNPEYILIGALRIMALAVFLYANLAFLFATDAPSPVTVMVTNIGISIGALVNFVYWTHHTNGAIGAMVMIILSAVGMSLLANEVHTHGARRAEVLHNAWTGVIMLTAFLSSWFIGIASV